MTSRFFEEPTTFPRLNVGSNGGTNLETVKRYIQAHRGENSPETRITSRIAGRGEEAVN
jgi:hypothetical protein